MRLLLLVLVILLQQPYLAAVAKRDHPMSPDAAAAVVMMVGLPNLDVCLHWIKCGIRGNETLYAVHRIIPAIFKLVIARWQLTTRTPLIAPRLKLHDRMPTGVKHHE